MYEEQINQLDFGALDMVVERGLPMEQGSFGELALAVLRGEVNLGLPEIFNWLLSGIFAEVGSLFFLLRHLIIVAILSAFFKAMTSSFKSSGISKLGTYVCYIIVISLLFRTFAFALSIMSNMVGGIAELLTAATPLIVTLVASSGYVASASAFAPILIFSGYFMTFVLEHLMVPVLIFAAAISLVSFVSEKESLDKLSKVMHKGVSFGLKSAALVFVTVLGFARISTPILNTAALRGTRTIMSAVPVVGNALSSALGTAMYYAQAVRGAVSAGLLVAAVSIIIVPIIQIAAFVMVYKLTAALIAPICDERIVDAIDATGSFTALALGVCALAGFLFVFIVLATLSL